MSQYVYILCFFLLRDFDVIFSVYYFLFFFQKLPFSLLLLVEAALNEVLVRRLLSVEQTHNAVGHHSLDRHLAVADLHAEERGLALRQPVHAAVLALDGRGGELALRGLGVDGARHGGAGREEGLVGGGGDLGGVGRLAGVVEVNDLVVRHADADGLLAVLDEDAEGLGAGERRPVGGREVLLEGVAEERRGDTAIVLAARRGADGVDLAGALEHGDIDELVNVVEVLRHRAGLGRGRAVGGGDDVLELVRDLRGLGVLLEGEAEGVDVTVGEPLVLGELVGVETLVEVALALAADALLREGVRDDTATLHAGDLGGVRRLVGVVEHELVAVGGRRLEALGLLAVLEGDTELGHLALREPKVGAEAEGGELLGDGGGVRVAREGADGGGGDAATSSSGGGAAESDKAEHFVVSKSFCCCKERS
eukprot:PhM_4_TR747/c0_g1_i1/m.43303